MVSRRGSAICHPSRGDACAGGDVAERGPCSSRLCCVPCRSAQAGPRGDHAAPRV